MMGMSLLFDEMVDQANLCLEIAAERIKKSTLVVGYIYDNLGANYMETNWLQSSVQMLLVERISRMCNWPYRVLLRCIRALL